MLPEIMMVRAEAATRALTDKLPSSTSAFVSLPDRAAAVLYPNSTPQTRNRRFYTPVSAVLKRAGVTRQIKRPKGWRGTRSKSPGNVETAGFLAKHGGIREANR
jgi:hypothetical protein